MRRLLIIVFVLLLSGVVQAGKLKFPVNKCPLPFNEEASSGLVIDKVCGLTGNADTPAKKHQDAAKNNLCEPPGAAAQPITMAELQELQQEVDAAHLPYGNTFNHKPGPPADRSGFQSLPPLSTGHAFKEGDVVTLVAFVGDTHYSPKSSSGSGESSNCSLTDHEMVDIHVSLVGEPGEITKKDPQRIAKLCHSATAEIIPHLRPEVWQNDWITDVMRLERPVRITGQLFFDASHSPCNGDQMSKGDPERMSDWEVHPVYRIEVCKHATLAECGSADANWQKISDVPELKDTEQEP